MASAQITDVRTTTFHNSNANGLHICTGKLRHMMMGTLPEMPADLIAAESLLCSKRDDKDVAEKIADICSAHGLDTFGDDSPKYVIFRNNKNGLFYLMKFFYVFPCKLADRNYEWHYAWMPISYLDSSFGHHQAHPFKTDDDVQVLSTRDDDTMPYVQTFCTRNVTLMDLLRNTQRSPGVGELDAWGFDVLPVNRRAPTEPEESPEEDD